MEFYAIVAKLGYRGTRSLSFTFWPLFFICTFWYYNIFLLNNALGGCYSLPLLNANFSLFVFLFCILHWFFLGAVFGKEINTAEFVIMQASFLFFSTLFYQLYLTHDLRARANSFYLIEKAVMLKDYDCLVCKFFVFVQGL